MFNKWYDVLLVHNNVVVIPLKSGESMGRLKSNRAKYCEFHHSSQVDSSA